MYVLDKKKVFDSDKAIGQPQLGAPQNEHEAQLLEMLLNKHHDYIEEKKRKAASTTNQ